MDYRSFGGGDTGSPDISYNVRVKRVLYIILFHYYYILHTAVQNTCRTTWPL